jgi:hypothetical protein
MYTKVQTWKTTLVYSSESKFQLERNLIINFSISYEDINRDCGYVWEDPPVALRSNALVCDLPTTGIAGSSLAGAMVFRFLYSLREV